MGNSVGGASDLDLANGSREAPESDLLTANRGAAQSPVGSTRRVPGPCASDVQREKEREREGGKTGIFCVC